MCIRDRYKDLTGFPLKDWRPVEDKEIEQTSEDASNSYNEEDANINEPDQIDVYKRQSSG